MSTLSVVTANLWNANPDVLHDLRKVCNSGAVAIGLNESKQHNAAINKVARSHDFRVFQHTDRDDNIVLLREDVPLLNFEHRRLASPQRDDSGTVVSHNRTGNAVGFEWEGQPVTFLNVHLSTAQDHAGDWDGGLVEGPEGPEWVRSMKKTTGWARDLQDLGYRTVVAGDLNWAYLPRSEESFRWAPVKAFHRRCRMHCQFEEEIIDRPTRDRRMIEYVFWNRCDFDYVSQRFVGPESSDHPFHLVELDLHR